jgi:hypothetical protein
MIRNHVHPNNTDSGEKFPKPKINIYIYIINNLNKNNGSVVTKNSFLGINHLKMAHRGRNI